jgi:hypothetical protein
VFLIVDVGMTQCVYDQRVFTRFRDGELLVVLVHVDDSRFLHSSDEVRDGFLCQWATRFGEKPDFTPFLGKDEFTGLMTTEYDKDTLNVRCRAVIQSLKELIEPFPLPPGTLTTLPMAAEAPARLLEPVSDANPLVPELLVPAQRIGGTCAFVTSKVRMESFFAFCVLARYINKERLTRCVFIELLRLAAYLVDTIDIPLTFRRVGPGFAIEAVVDSSQNNGPGRRSYGGFIVRFSAGGKHSAPIIWNCAAPASVAEATGVSELHQIVRAAKAVIGVRIFLRELRLPPLHPTPIYTDAKVVMDGSRCRRVSRESKWVATRYAMVRKAEADGAIVLVKHPTEELDADILTKPLTGAKFVLARARVMCLDA